MQKRNSTYKLERKIDLYLNGQLPESEIDALWEELIKREENMEYLKTAANLRAVLMRRRREKQHRTGVNSPRWMYYAAAAAVALIIGVMAVYQWQPWTPAQGPLEPVAKVELDYYRSANGVATESNRRADVITEAIRLANSGQDEHAISLLKESLPKADNLRETASIRINLASLYFNRHQYNSTLDALQPVLNKEKLDVLTQEKAWWIKAQAHMHLKQTAKAKAAFEKVYDFNGAYRRTAANYLEELK